KSESSPRFGMAPTSGSSRSSFAMPAAQGMPTRPTDRWPHSNFSAMRCSLTWANSAPCSGEACYRLRRSREVSDGELTPGRTHESDISERSVDACATAGDGGARLRLNHEFPKDFMRRRLTPAARVTRPSGTIVALTLYFNQSEP